MLPAVTHAAFSSFLKHRAKTAEEGEAPLTKPKAKRKSPTKKVKADASTADGASEAAADALSDDSPGKKYVLVRLISQ